MAENHGLYVLSPFFFFAGVEILYCTLALLSARYWGKSLDAVSDEDKEEEKRGFVNNGFNQFRSDRIQLDREIPDTRDPR